MKVLNKVLFLIRKLKISIVENIHERQLLEVSLSIIAKLDIETFYFSRLNPTIDSALFKKNAFINLID